MKKVLINVEERELRVAILEDDQLIELFTESLDEKNILNNIYRGRIEGVIPGLKAAFVDIGLERNAFLHFDDIRPDILHAFKRQREQAHADRRQDQVEHVPEPVAEYQPSQEELAAAEEVAVTTGDGDDTTEEAVVQAEATSVAQGAQDDSQEQESGDDAGKRRKRRRGRRGGRRRNKGLATGEQVNPAELPHPFYQQPKPAPVQEPVAPAEPGNVLPKQDDFGPVKPRHAVRPPAPPTQPAPPVQRAAFGTRAASNPYDVFSPYAMQQQQNRKRQQRKPRRMQGGRPPHKAGGWDPVNGPPPNRVRGESQEDFFPPPSAESAKGMYGVPPAAAFHGNYAEPDETGDGPAPGNERFPENQQHGGQGRPNRPGGHRRSMRRKGPAYHAVKKQDEPAEKPAKKTARKTAAAATPAKEAKVAKVAKKAKKDAKEEKPAKAVATRKSPKAKTVAEVVEKAPAAKARGRKTKAAAVAVPETAPVVVVEEPKAPVAAAKPAKEAKPVKPAGEKPARGRKPASRKTAAEPPAEASIPQAPVEQAIAALPPPAHETPAPEPQAAPVARKPESAQPDSAPARIKGHRPWRRQRGGQQAPAQPETEPAGAQDTPGTAAVVQPPVTVAEPEAAPIAEPAGMEAPPVIAPAPPREQSEMPSPRVEQQRGRQQRSQQPRAQQKLPRDHQHERRREEKPRQFDKPRRERLYPQDVLRKGDEIMVQIIKEEIGLKGARISTYVSLPGRFLVLLPHPNEEGGVSRKVENFQERKRLKKILHEISSDNMGFIVRTAGIDRDERDIRSDVEFLTQEWHRVEKLYDKAIPTQLVYDDHDILYRLARDVFDDSVSEIVIDSAEEADKLKGVLKQLIPSLVDRVKIYSDPTNIFRKYDIERQIQKAARRKVWLKSGGYLIIDEAEALTAIDVNSGKFVGKDDQEKMILKTNLEAAKSIARELKLRDIGGLIVIDFIDMRDHRNKEQLLSEFRMYLKKDRSKTSVSNVSEFGLVEMTRKRVRQSLKKTLFMDCPYCQAAGVVLSERQIWMHIKHEIIRSLEGATPAPSLNIVVNPKIRTFIEQNYREALQRYEEKYGVDIRFSISDVFHVENYAVEQITSGGQRIPLPVGIEAESI